MAVHIVYIFDEKYAICSGISAISAVKFAKEKLIFHCIGIKAQRRARQILQRIIRTWPGGAPLCDKPGDLKVHRQKANHLKYLIRKLSKKKKYST